MSGIVGKNPGRGSGVVGAVPIADESVDSDAYIDGSVDLAHLQTGTDGQIITWDASGDPVAVGPGSDGQLLTSTGAGSPPAFEAAPGGGKILQVVAPADRTTTTTTTSTTFVTTNLAVAITPAATSSRILILATWASKAANHNEHCYTLMRDSTNIGDADEGFYVDEGNSRVLWAGLSVVDSPSSTSEITYSIYFRGNSGSNTLTMGDGQGNDLPHQTITAIEIGA